MVNNVHMAGSDLVIRAASPDDAGALAEAWVEFGRYYENLNPVRFRVPKEEGLVEWEEKKLREEPGEDRIWLVAERAGRLVGYIVAAVWNPQDEADREIMRELGETTLRVHALMVTEDERRKGVGRALMEAAEDR